MKWFYNVETQQYENMEAIRTAYNTYAEEYETFSDFLSACMTVNNGALQDLSTRWNKVNKMLNNTDPDEPEERKALANELKLIETMMKGA